MCMFGVFDDAAFPDVHERAVQLLAETFPLTHIIRINRGVLLRGADFSDVWP